MQIMQSNCGASSSGFTVFRRRVLWSAICLGLSPLAYGLPQGGEVVAGGAALQVQGRELIVRQHTDRAVIDYQSFNVASDERVQFIQPDATSVTLNRVIGNDLAQIDGRIDANGQIYLINPNGVVFGDGARVDVGGLMVSTLDIANQDFLAGDLALAGSGGRIENHGLIQAADGVYLVAPEIVNTGGIAAEDVGLVSGRAVLIKPKGSEIAMLADSESLRGNITQSGTIDAGRVLMAMQAPDTDSRIRNDGLVRAVAASGAGGQIALLAPDAKLINSGQLDASAAHGRGGDVVLTAAQIDQSGSIAADGGAGSGSAGGEIHLRATDAIAMHSGSSITANAGLEGKGGSVIAIAERGTWFLKDASISARGGDQAGDGGFVEVSGHEYVGIAGEVDVGANHGDSGLWFIDPTDINIGNSDLNGTFVFGDPTEWSFAGTPATAQIHVLSLYNALVNGDVVISTASDADSAGNITFTSVLDYNGVGGLRTLNLLADGEIVFQSGSGMIDTSDGDSDGLNLVAIAGTGFRIDDDVAVHSGIGKINVTVESGDAVVTGLGSFATGVDAVSLTVNAGSIIDGGNALWDFYTASAGAGITLNARDGVDDLQGIFRTLDAVSTNGNIKLAVDSSVSVARLSAGGWANLVTTGTIALADTSVLQGETYLDSDTLITVAEPGVTTTGLLQLHAPDIVNSANGRTITVAAGDLIINTEATGGALQFNTDADSLVLMSDSANAITVTDLGDLTLTGITSGGGTKTITAGRDLTVGEAIELDGFNATLNLVADNDLNINASMLDTVDAVDNATELNLSAGNHVNFAADSSVNAGSGSLSITATTGDLNLGEVIGEAVSLVAGQNITDANGSAINLIADSATLASGGASGTTADALESQVNTLNLDAGGDASVTNNRALTLGTVDVGGDFVLALPTAGNLTVSQASPSVAGEARFTVAAGQLVLGGGALHLEGDLVVNAAGGITDGDSTVTLSAAHADLSIGGPAAVLDVDFDTLALRPLDGQTMQVTDANGLTLTDIDTTGDLIFATATADFAISDTTPNIGGDLTVSIPGDFVVPEAGLAVGGALTVSASNLRSAASTLSLAGTSADIQLSDGGNAQTWNTAFDSLVLNIAGSGALTIVDEDALDFTITTGGSADISTTGADLTFTSASSVAGDLALRTLGSGDVIVPATGLTSAGALTIEADNLYSPDASLSLGALDAVIDLRDGSGDVVWNTAFDSLVLDIAGTGALTIVDENALDFTITTGGSADISTTGADLTFTSASSVAGDLALRTLGSGDVIVPAAGLTSAGTLTIEADNLRDDDNTLTLAATNADIRLRGGNADVVWNTAFESLVLDIAGNGALTIVDENALDFTITTGGSADISTTGADLTFTSASSVAGDLALRTLGSGDVIVPAAGLISAGTLTIEADNLRDGDSILSLAATNADIRLRGGDADAVWNTAFDSLVLDIAGNGALTLVDADSLDFTITTGGSADISTTGADLTFTSASSVAGDLALRTLGSGDVIVPATGLTSAGTLTIEADNLRDDDNTLTLAATNADIRLRDGSVDVIWDTAFDSLVLAIAGNGALTLVDADSLDFTINTGGSADISTTGADLTFTSASSVAGDLALRTVSSGDVIVPAAGLTSAGTLTIEADNLSNGSNTLSLAATNADIRLRGGNADAVWNTAFDSLVLAIAGNGALTLVDADSLDFTINTGGSADISTTGADLIFGDASSVAGDLALRTVGSGDVIVPATGLTSAGALTIEADNLSDGDNVVSLAATDAVIDLRDASAGTTLNTAFDTLSINVEGGGLELANSRSLGITGFALGGDASLSIAGDLDMADAIAQVAGDLTLDLTGDWIVPDSGLVLSNQLNLVAADIRDSDSDIALQADRAVIHLTAGDADARWTSAFNRLDLTREGSGALTLDNDRALRVEALETGGDLSLSVTGDLSLATATPQIGGHLSILTRAGGDLVLSDAGLAVAGDLTIDVNDLYDSDRIVDLAANEAHVRLRGLEQALALNTRFARSRWDLLGASVRVDQRGAHQLLGVTASADFTLTTDADLRVAPALLNVQGEARLDTGSNILFLGAPSLSSLAGLAIRSADLVAQDGGAVRLGAERLALELEATDRLMLDLAVAELALSAQTASSVSIANDSALRLSEWRLGNGVDLEFDIDGALVLPETGLNAVNRLRIAATDLSDDDRSVRLGATQLQLALSEPAEDLQLETELERADVSLGGSAGLTLNQTGSLTLVDLDGDGSALRVNDGDARVVLTAGDLWVEGNVSARDASPDEVRRGAIELLVSNGNIGIGHTQDVHMHSDAGADAAPAGASAAGIRLQLTGTEVEDRAITLGSGTTQVALVAEGADLVLHARASETPAGSARTIVQNPGVSLQSYDASGDPLSGIVTINGREVEPGEAQLIGQGRRLEMVMDYEFPVPEESDYLDEIRPPVIDPSTSDSQGEGVSADARFVQVFGQCNEADDEQEQRCRIESALKAFLSHWLVGGEMPPKTEI